MAKDNALEEVDLTITVSNPDDPGHKVQAIFGRCEAAKLLAAPQSTPRAVAALTEMLLSNYEGHAEVSF